MSDTSHASASRQNTFAGCLARIFWVVVGNGALVIVALMIAEGAWWPPTWRDAAYWAVVAALAVVRLVDIRWLDGRTAEGGPATAADLRRYVVGLLAVAAGLWVLAHLAAKLGLMK
jgi:hypothetical protein